jgi:propionyl-CoA synthetase
MHRILVRRGSTYAGVYRSSIEHPEKFWGEQAQRIDWFKKYNKIYDKNNLLRPHWFQDGQLNMAYNCLDRHIPKHANQPAIIHDSAMTGKVTRVTYQQLLQQVKTLANVLSQKYNVKKGDVVLIYMPMIPEAVVAMLACARIGAIHNLVFGGFSASELAVRIKHSEPKVLISGKKKNICVKEYIENFFC